MNCVEDPVLDGKNKPCLLIMVRAYTHGSKKLPNVDVFAGVDIAREDVRQRWLQLVEQGFKGAIPVKVSNMFVQLNIVDLPFLPLLSIARASLLEQHSTAENQSEHRDTNPCLGNHIDLQLHCN